VHLPRLAPLAAQGSGDDHVFTKQVAPTILKALDLDPRALQAVVEEQTKILPGLDL
jgi:hypothetical protein